LPSQIAWSVAISLATGVGGYLAATAVPAAFGKDAVNAAGAMTLVAGGLLAFAIVASPRHGVVTRVIRRRRLAARIATDDLLAALFRAEELEQDGVARDELPRLFAGRAIAPALRRASRDGLVTADPTRVRLTETGHAAASEIVRRHRLWEHYLVDEAGFAPDHVHEPAEQLEHIATQPPPGPELDPHGRAIP
jgi:manganese/zinc/iron transport system permease protein